MFISLERSVVKVNAGAETGEQGAGSLERAARRRGHKKGQKSTRKKTLCSF